jgi:uncharacterized protein (DUF1800 family)
MDKHRFYNGFWHLCGKCFGFVLAAFLVCCTTALLQAQDNENFESSSPVLISQADSIAALTANPDDWRGTLPAKSDESFAPGSRVVVFVSNIDFPKGESANSFRAFAKDKNGKNFRLVVENIQPLRKQDWIYGLTLRIFDENAYNGQPSADGGVLIHVSWRGNISNRVALGLGQTTDKLPQYPGMIPTPAPTSRITEASLVSPLGDRGRFMEQAAFGPSSALDLRLKRIGLRRWVEDQFVKAYPTFPYPNFPLKPFDGAVGCGVYDTSPEVNLCYRNHYWAYNNQKWMMQEALYGEDQLRRRVSWALHQTWVVSNTSIYQQRWLQEYVEILDKHAFGNYRNLMAEMTLSPAMGEYLDMVRSTRFNPNENYPRELLQLFTIGLYKLNQDGTLALDGAGNRIPTYDQDKINQFTKVFTGWSQCNTGGNPACSNAVPGSPNFIDPMSLIFPNDHDLTAKSLFDYPGAPNSTIPACSNCTTDAARRAYATDSLTKTLDNIFNHPNVGPYIGKLLIQHLVMSDPSPAYVGRVAAAFNNNGSGVRGDMKAVIRAILFDPEARGSRKTDPSYGKLREPLQYLTNYLRTLNVRAGSATAPATCQNRSDGVFDWLTREMGQDVWGPPTVFNYFSPDYVVPGTDNLGPEFALANTGTSFARNNTIFYFTFGNIGFGPVTAADPYPYVPCGTSINLTEPTAWMTADPSGNTLIEGLNAKMMHGSMSEAMKTKIRTAINFNVSADSKVKQAIYLVATSSQYQVQK